METASLCHLGDEAGLRQDSACHNRPASLEQPSSQSEPIAGRRVRQSAAVCENRQVEERRRADRQRPSTARSAPQWEQSQEGNPQGHMMPTADSEVSRVKEINELAWTWRGGMEGGRQRRRRRRRGKMKRRGEEERRGGEVCLDKWSPSDEEGGLSERLREEDG
ncbi:Hypothetical predicted protein [Xyrichtys novacula]|uniref:Uncharacterized protein n=1 Tax=Xyrichtys novacula TaxID=13765 RepID=A0AAV1FEI0_XYRNO|nr:Hypothetical predicted protein [Xyrichtys novacula]